MMRASYGERTAWMREARARAHGLGAATDNDCG